MQVNPDDKWYGEILGDDEEQLKQMNELMEKDEEVVVVSNSKEQLQKLQDDLRKAGYRKLK